MGTLEAPQDRHGQEHRTGTSRAEQIDGGPSGAGSSGGHGRCGELRRPWQVRGAQEAMAGAGSSGGHGRCGELRRPWQVRGAQEAMAERGAQKAMAEQGAQKAMAEQGAQKAMAEQGAQEAMAGGPRGHGLGPLGPATPPRALLPPPKKIPWGN